MNSLLVFDAAFFVTFFTFNSGYLDDTPPEISPQDPFEYCSGEEFRARCSSPDEVVVINDATYGRAAAAGRCFSEAEQQQMGCSANFTEHLDALCSGRRSCTLRVPNADMNRVNKCPQSMKASLYASYRCVKVAGGSCRSCHTSGHAKVTGDRGYLASIVTMETQNDEDCGSSRCPWLIQVPAGQGINLTLIDFSAGPHQLQPVPQPTSPQRPGVPSSDRCPRLLVVKERANPKDSQVCGGRARWKHIHLSVSHFVEVHVVGQDVLSGKGQFLVYYEAVGCPDVTPPKNSRMKRMHNECEIDCPGTPLKWVLTCVDNKWVGEMGKCPASPMSPLEAMSTARPTSSGVWPLLQSLPLNVLITLVVAVTVIIGVVIITTGIVCLKKNRYKSRHRPDSAIYTGACSEFEFRQDLVGANTALVPKPSAPGTALLVAPSSKPRRPSADLLMPVRDNTYAVDRGMESRPLPAIPDATPHSSIQRDHLNRVMVQIHPSMETVNSNQARPTIVCRGGGVGPGRDERRALPPSASPAHRGHAGPVSGGGGGVPHGDNHHYFILDPDVLVEEPATPCPEHSLGYHSTECQTQPLALPYRKSPAGQEPGPVQGRVGLPAGQQGSSDGANGIQLRPIREGSSNPQKRASPQSGSNSGIGSWP